MECVTGRGTCASCPSREPRAAVSRGVRLVLIPDGWCGVDSVRKLDSMHGVAKTAVDRATKRCARCIVEVFGQNAVSWPRTEAQRRAAVAEWARERPTLLDKVLGALDGTHIKLVNVSAAVRDSYYNRKQFLSLNAVVIADCRQRIRCFDIRWPGSVHDSRAFNTTHFAQHLQELVPPPYYLLADSGAFSAGCVRFWLDVSPSSAANNSRCALQHTH